MVPRPPWRLSFLVPRQGNEGTRFPWLTGPPSGPGTVLWTVPYIFLTEKYRTLWPRKMVPSGTRVPLVPSGRRMVPLLPLLPSPPLGGSAPLGDWALAGYRIPTRGLGFSVRKTGHFVIYLLRELILCKAQIHIIRNNIIYIMVI